MAFRYRDMGRVFHDYNLSVFSAMAIEMLFMLFFDCIADK